MEQISVMLWEAVGVKVQKRDMCEVVRGVNETAVQTDADAETEAEMKYEGEQEEEEEEGEEEEEEEEYCFWAN